MTEKESIYLYLIDKYSKIYDDENKARILIYNQQDVTWFPSIKLSVEYATLMDLLHDKLVHIRNTLS